MVKIPTVSSAAVLAASHSLPEAPVCSSGHLLSVGVFVFAFLRFFFFYVDEFLKNNFTYFGCIGSLLVHGLFSSCRAWGPLSGCGARDSHCGGFSCCGAWSPGWWASVVAAPGLQSAQPVGVAHGLRCSMAYRIFPDQGSIPPNTLAT